MINIALTTSAATTSFAGEINNEAGVNILQHKVRVTFLNSSNAVLETKTVDPCLRTLLNGGVNFFSAQSTKPRGLDDSEVAGAVNFDRTFKLDGRRRASGTISDLR